MTLSNFILWGHLAWGPEESKRPQPQEGWKNQGKEARGPGVEPKCTWAPPLWWLSRVLHPCTAAASQVGSATNRARHDPLSPRLHTVSTHVSRFKFYERTNSTGAHPPICQAIHCGLRKWMPLGQSSNLQSGRGKAMWPSKAARSGGARTKKEKISHWKGLWTGRHPVEHLGNLIGQLLPKETLSLPRHLLRSMILSLLITDWSFPDKQPRLFTLPPPIITPMQFLNLFLQTWLVSSNFSVPKFNLRNTKLISFFAGHLSSSSLYVTNLLVQI